MLKAILDALLPGRQADASADCQEPLVKQLLDAKCEAGGLRHKLRESEMTIASVRKALQEAVRKNERQQEQLKEPWRNATLKGIAERLVRNKLTSLADDEALALGMLPPGWKRVELPKEERVISVRYDTEIDGARVQWEVQNIRVAEISEVMASMNGKPKNPCPCGQCVAPK